MLRVFICGAHSTGKTTLLNRLLSEPDQNLFAVHEVARNIIAENGWKAEDFDPKLNPRTFYEFQVKILQAQSSIDGKYCDQKKSYISDRGLDPIIYCLMYLEKDWFRQIMNTKEAKECIERHKASNTLTVILSPHQECIHEDGTRLTPKMDELIKFTKLLQEFLKEHDIKSETITDLCLDNRVTLLKFLIKDKKKSVLNSVL